MKSARLFPLIALAWLNAIGCIQVRQSDDDAECDTDKDCSSDLLCRDGECVDRGEGGESGKGGTGGSSRGGTGGGTPSGGSENMPTESGCLASWEALAKKCSISETYRQPVLDDCEDRRSSQPPACLDEYDAALACEASESAWTCSEGGTVQGSPTGCAEQIAIHQSCLDANVGEGTGGTGNGGTGGGTPAGGTGGGSSGQGGAGGSLASCALTECTENYCAMLTIWCDWDVKHEFSTKPYASCAECVQAHRGGQAPYTYCRLNYLCWNTCAQQYEAQGIYAVSDCIDAVCDSDNGDGTGLCQQCDSDADDICAPPLTCDEGRHQCVMPG